MPDYLFNEAENKWYLLNTGNGNLDDLEKIILEDESVSPDVKIEIRNGRLNAELNEELEEKNMAKAVLKV